MKRSLKKSMVKKLTQVQYDAPKVVRHSEFISESQIRQQVQYDGEWENRHPEFISGSNEILKPVQNDRFQFGRSMVEMLGVLAIIGVLSIGGLYAYKQAMNRYRLNEAVKLLNEINFLFMDKCVLSDNKCQLSDANTKQVNLEFCTVLDKCQTNTNLNYNLSEPGWALHAAYNGSSPYYIFYLKNYPKDFCKSLGNISWKLDAQNYIGKIYIGKWLVENQLSVFSQNEPINVTRLNELCDTNENYKAILILVRYD